MKRVMLIVLFFLTASAVAFQARPLREGLDRFLFPPDIIMRNQAELGLTPDQKRFILEQTYEAQKVFTSAKWELEANVEELSGMLRDQESDEETILVKLDETLELERQIKRAQLLLAYRIRQSLTPEQRGKLRRLRPPAPLGGPADPRPGSPQETP